MPGNDSKLSTTGSSKPWMIPHNFKECRETIYLHREHLPKIKPYEGPVSPKVYSEQSIQA
jgi:hypothetical protein